MNDQPLVSVLMTAYNREKFIGESIESVLSSTYKNFELIIVDDCSKDNTVKIAKEYAVHDCRIKVYSNEKNLGDYPNRNKAAYYARGTYLKYVDSDDKIFSHTLSVMVNGMEMNPKAVLGISSRYADKPPIGEHILLSPEEAYKTHFFDFGLLDNGPSFTILKRFSFESSGGFGLKRNVSDFEMWLKLAAKNYVLVFSNQLVEWTQHEGQEFKIAPDCYLEHQYSILKKALDPQYSPLNKSDSLAILKKYKKLTLRGIAKHFVANKNLKTFFSMMKTNDLNLKDFFSLLK